MKVSVNISGVKGIQSRLARAPQETLQALEGAVYQEAQLIMRDSRPLVPVDTGALRSTGHVQNVQRDGEKVEVSFGYGGPAAPYALTVHENMDPNVKWSVPGTGPKYLERPFLERQQGMASRIANRIKRRVMTNERS
jgi:hypothetical protein